MLVDITLSNYRCFPAARPATVTIGSGATAFVGENNAGKSAILRALHDLRPLIPSTGQGIANAIADPPRNIGSGVRDVDELFTARSPGPLTLRICPQSVTSDTPTRCRVLGLELRMLPRANGGGNRVTLLTDPPSDPAAPWMVDGDGLIYRDKERGVVQGSAVRLVEALAMLAETIYIPSTRHVQAGAGDHFDLKHADAFAAMWQDLQNGHSVSGKDTADRIEQALAELFGVSSVRINKTTGQPGIQFRLGNDSQRRSDELGNGLAQAAVTIFTVALKRPSLILIDEPEIGLHPKLQTRFLHSLQGFATTGIVFSTHNLGLAMNAAERVYAVKRHETGSTGRAWSEVTPFVETLDLAAFLGSLSHSSYGEVSSRSVLLVEGPSDVRMVQVLLTQLGLADSVVAIHAGGSSTYDNAETAKAQLAGLTRVCRRVWCLADSECSDTGVAAAKRAEFKEVCDALNIPCLVTKRKALENYLTDAACRAAFHPGARSLGACERHDPAAVKWDKCDAWRAVTKMEASDWAGTDVWEFFSRIGGGAVGQI